MPRRKTKGDDQLLNAEPLMLPPPRPSTHKHGHDLDPYESLPGAVPVHVTTEPINRKMTGREIAARAEAQLEVKARGERYNRYLDAMIEFAGDQEQALADVYGLTVEEVRPRRLELQADVRNGLGSSDLADVLEQNDLTMRARATLLRKHAYSPNPAASLKAIDMVTELEGERSDVGSFESYLRLIKSQTK